MWPKNPIVHFQRPGVYNVAYVHDGTVHYKEALTSFEIRIGHSPGCGDIATIVQKAT